MFLSAEWLMDRPDYWRVSRFQDLPQEAFLEPDYAAWLYDQLGGLIIMSYPWLSKVHPDPQGFHFHHLQLYLRVHRQHFMNLPKPPGESFIDFGVFWDYASLPQPAISKCGERVAREPQEQQQFNRGLQTVAYLYGGNMTLVVQLKLMPIATFETMNRTPYDQRGWCYFEEMISSVARDQLYPALGKNTFQILNLALVGEKMEEISERQRFKVSGDQMVKDGYEWQLVASAAQGDRRPPMHPEQFRQELQFKSFSHLIDCDTVANRYAEYFFAVAPSIIEINLPHQSHTPNVKPWGSKEVDCLARALQAFSECMKLNLCGRTIGDSGAEKLAKILPSMTKLETLWLNNCEIGNKGMSALAPAILTLKKLVDIKLHGSRFTSIGLRELCDVAFFPWYENKEKESGWERSYLKLTALEDVTLPLELAKTAAAEALDRLVKTKTVQFSRLMIKWC